MSVRLFLTPLAVVAALVASVPAVAQVSLPDGKVGIHYNRCDKKYEGWGLHIWRSPNSTLPGVSWGSPMEPSGSNDFGVYWAADLDAFGAGGGQVNYIIHKGDNKEQGGSDMKFDAKTTREIWVNSGDSRIHTSLDAAVTARSAKPCP